MTRRTVLPTTGFWTLLTPDGPQLQLGRVRAQPGCHSPRVPIGAMPHTAFGRDTGRTTDMHKPLLIIAGTYLGAIGLALLLVPAQFGVNAVPDDPSPELIAFLRLLGGPFLGIAVLDWMSRNAQPSRINNTVILANTVGFGIVAANDIVGVLSGNARELAKVFLFVHLAFTVAFVVVWTRARRSAKSA